MKFKVGDKVKIKCGLQQDKRYGAFYLTNSMYKLMGRGAIVQEINVSDGGYLLDIYNEPWWTDKMLEPYWEDKPCKFMKKHD